MTQVRNSASIVGSKCAHGVASRAAGAPRSAGPIAHEPLLLAVPLALLDRRALVVLLLALGEPEFELDPPLAQMQIKRHQRVSGAFDLPDQAVDFPAMQQQLTRSRGIGDDMGGRRNKRCDVRADENDLAAFHDDVGFLDLGAPGAYGFNFPAQEPDARLEFLLDEVVVIGFSVVDDTHGHAYGTSARVTYSSNDVMRRVRKSVLVPYSADAMFELVDRIELYPQFLPWCGGTAVTVTDEGRKTARIDINFHGVRAHFTTDNVNRAGESIVVTLKDGPFRYLQGEWRFSVLASDACKVEFELAYEFATELLERAVGPVFNHIANTFIDAFVRRAETVYARAP